MATTKTRIGNLFFNYQGEYSSTKTYHKDDVVIYNNTDWICTKNSSTTGTAPVDNQRRYVRLTKAVSAGTGANAYKWDGEATWPQEEVQYKVGDTLVLYQDGADFDDNRVAFSNSSSNKATNLWHTDVTYLLDGKAVGAGTAVGDYFNDTTFNNAATREIRIDITKETPKEIYVFNFQNASAFWGPKIVVADHAIWKPIRQSFNWRGEHDNTNDTGSYLTYYTNDIVKVFVDVDNDYLHSTMNQEHIQRVRATYICIREHTCDGTNKFLPWDQEKDTDDWKYWERVSEEMQFDDEVITDSGAVATITNVSAGSPSRQPGYYESVNCINVTAAAENSGAGRTGGYNTPMFDVEIEGYQSAKTWTVESGAHYKRKKGIYKNLTHTSSTGGGGNCYWDFEVDQDGEVIVSTLTKKLLNGQMGGLGYAIDEELTFADAGFGGGGAPDVVLKISAIGTWGALLIKVSPDQRHGRQRSKWDNDNDTPLMGGENNAVSDQLKFDGYIFYASSSPTFDVASTQKKARGYQHRYSGNRLECMSLCNTSGPLGDDNKYYRLPGQFQQANCVNWPCFINGRGGITSWGSNSTGQAGLYIDGVLSGVGMTFPFLDWYRSSDNGGSGIHTTPDKETPKAIQLISGYECGMALFNNGEIYHWGYGGQGQSGDASTTSRNFPVRPGGTYQEVYAAANTSTHTLMETRINRIWMSNWGGNNNVNSHSCYALDSDGEMWAWGYNNYGQLGDNTTTDKTRPQKISKSTYFNNNKILAFWTAGAQHAFCYALDDEGKLYSWGYNGYGQLANGNTTNLHVPTEITSPVFDNVGASSIGGIKKLLIDSEASYGRVAILTDKGQIFWTGRNEFGWAMMGNTTDVSTFTKMSSGPGSGSYGTCSNMWFTGNGRYASFYTKDQVGNIKCCGYNANYELGIGNSTNQTSPVTPKWQINGTTATDLENIKDIGCNSEYGNEWMCNVWVLTYDGFMFNVGRNNYGLGCQGWSSSYNDRQSTNGIEETDDYYFQMQRMPNFAHGRIEDVRGRGYYSSDGNRYHFREVRTFDNRYLLWGYGGSYIMGQNDGDYHSMAQPPVLC